VKHERLSEFFLSNGFCKFSRKTPVFTGQNYGVWAVKIETYLKAFNLWEIVESDRQPILLGNNPTIAQMKFFNEEKAKRFKALTCLHNAVSEEIFTRIMACKSAKEMWDKLKAEFHGDEKSRKMQVLNLIMQFEGLKMRETDIIKDFSSQISKLVNQVRLLGDDFPDSRIVEKVLVSLLEKFEHKICSLEDSKDFSEMSLKELVNALQAVEQRQAYRQEGTSEGALIAVYKEKSRAKNFYRNNQEEKREKGRGWQSNNWQQNNNNIFTEGKEKKEQFPAWKYCQKTNHLEDWCWLKNSQCRNCKQFGHIQRFCKNKAETVKQAQVAESSEVEEDLLFMATIQEMCNIAKANDSSWLIDSGCTNHMTADMSLFKDLDKSYLSRVRIGNGDYVKVEGKGAIEVETLSGTKTLKNVIYVPKINQNLVSVGQLIESGYSIFFNDGVCDIKDKNGVLLLFAKMMNRSFNVDWREVCLSANTCENNESVLWHKRLGHFNYATLKRMADLQMTHGLPDIQEKKSICEACQLGKQTRVVFPDNVFRALSKLQLVHTDVCGPMHNESLNGSKYFLLFVDDYSRFCWICFLKSKSYVFAEFVKFKAAVELETGNRFEDLRGRIGMCSFGTKKEC